MNDLPTYDATRPRNERVELFRENAGELKNLIYELERVQANNDWLIYSQTSFGEFILEHLAGHGFHTLKFTSIGYEIIRLCALWDFSAEERISIPTLVNLLSEIEVRRSLKYDFMNRYAEESLKKRMAAMKKFDTYARQAKSASRKVLCSQSLKTLKEHRHRHFAHNLINETDPPRLRVERQMLSISRTIAVRLLFIAGEGLVDFSDLRDICKNQADQFWRGLEWAPPGVADNAERGGDIALPIRDE